MNIRFAQTAAAVLSCLIPLTACGQSYPSKPIRLLVAFPPGGTSDLLARMLGQKVAESVGQQIIVDNRPGAGGHICAELAARSAPDGYTLLFGTAFLTIGVSLYSKLKVTIQPEAGIGACPIKVNRNTSNKLCPCLCMVSR